MPNYDRDHVDEFLLQISSSYYVKFVRLSACGCVFHGGCEHYWTQMELIFARPTGGGCSLDYQQVG